MKKSKQSNSCIRPLPNGEKQAVQWLMQLVQAADAKKLRKLPTDIFKRGWFSIGFLYPGLHPDSATCHGTKISNDVENQTDVSSIDQRLLAPVYVESGWPVVLEPIAKEAWRRYEVEELTDDEFYCSEAIIAGMCDRNPALLNARTRSGLPSSR